MDELGNQIGNSAVDSFIQGIPRIIDAAKPLLSNLVGDAGMSIVNDVKNSAKEGSQAASKVVKEGLSDAFSMIESGAQALVDFDFSKINMSDMKAALDKMKAAIKDADVGNIAASLGIEPSKLKQMISDVGAFISKNAEEKGINVISMALDIDKEEVKKMIDLVKDLGGPLINIGAIAESVIAVKAIGSIKKMKTAVSEIENTMMGVDRAAAKMSQGFVTFGEKGSSSFADVREGVKAYRAEALSFVASTGKSLEEYASFTEELNTSNLSFKEINTSLKNFSTSVGASNAPISGLEAALALAKGTGVSTKDVFDDLALFTKSLGLTAEQAAKRYGLFNQVILGTQLNSREARKELMESTKTLRFYGDTSKATARIYKGFLNALGTGQEGIAGELLQKATGALGQMDVGLKAFLGTVGGMGTGGGALQAAGEVELAIEEGRGAEVMQTMIDQIEKFSGAPLLTLQEAVESGQMQQLTMQKQMLQTMGIGVANDREATKMIEAMRNGIADLEIDQETGVKAVVRAGREQMAMETGPLERAANLAEAKVNLDLTEEMSGNMLTSSQKFADSSDKLESAVNTFAAAIKERVKSAASVFKAPEAIIDKPIASDDYVELARNERYRAARTGEHLTGLTKDESEKTTSLFKQSADQEAQTFDVLRKYKEATIDTTADPAKLAAATPEATREKLTDADKLRQMQQGGTGAMQNELLARKIDIEPVIPLLGDVGVIGPTAADVDTMATTKSDDFQALVKSINDLVTAFAAKREAGGIDSNVNVTVKLGEKDLRDVVTDVTKKELRNRDAAVKGQR